MSIEFSIINPSQPTKVLIKGQIGDKSFSDKDPNVISYQEARHALKAIEKLLGEKKFPPGINPKKCIIQIGKAKMQIAALGSIRDPRRHLFNAIEKIFENQNAYKQWRAMIEKKYPNISSKKLDAFRKALWNFKWLANSKKTNGFQKILSSSVRRDKKNILVLQTERLTGVKDLPKDAFQALAMDDVNIKRWVNAVWKHPNDYGKGRIGAPNTTCSLVVHRYSKNHLVQQIVFDVPGPDLMTLNDSHLKSYGGIGFEHSWELVSNPRPQWLRWCDGEGEGVKFNFNQGYWRLLPIAQDRTLVWSGIESDSKYLNAPDFTARNATQENLYRFHLAAHRWYGN